MINHQREVTREGGREEEEEDDCYMIIIVSNKPKDVTFMICSPPRGWPGLTGHGEVVSHRDGEVGALAPLTGLSPGPGRAAHRAGAHGQTDPLPGPAQRVRCGARHPALRGRAGHPHQPLTSLTRARWTQKILMTSEVQFFLPSPISLSL